MSAAPAGTAFYTPPSPLPAGEHGDVIWTRPLHNDAALPHAAENWLILYRSTDINGHPIAVSGTLAVPKGTPPKGGWPVISWAHGTTGAADQCAPSRNDAGYPAKAYVDLINQTLDQWLEQGYAVVKTDYQGLGTPGPHPYLIGPAEARNVVDMVLAARQVNDQLSREWLVMGHSQGGQAAVFTSYLGPLYAPELHLLGAVAISPASHLSELFKYALAHPQGPSSGYGALMMKSAAVASSEVKLQPLLTPLGQERMQLTEERCIAGLNQPDAWAGLTVEDALRLEANFEPLTTVLATLGDSERVRPTVPILVLQATNDRVVPKALTDQMVARFRNLGVDVTDRTYTIEELGDAATAHQATVVESLKDAMTWTKTLTQPEGS